MAGLHLNINLTNEKLLNEALDVLNKLDGPYLLFSGAGGRENSEENYLRNSKKLEECGKKSMERGVKVCYHDHWQEIIDNAKGMRIICENTASEHVALCIDTYWVKFGGLSPVEYVKANIDCIEYLHLKDGTEEGIKNRRAEFIEIGQGCIDFQSIMEAIKSSRVEWLIVEQDRTIRTPKESMAISRKYPKEEIWTMIA